MAYKKKRYKSRRSYAGSSVMRSLTEGYLDHVVSVSASQTLTQDAETNILTQGSDTERFIMTYIRGKYYLWSGATTLCLEWFCVKTPDSNVPDMSTETVLEKYQKEGRIFRRGIFVQPCTNGFGPPLPIQISLRSVTLEPGERIMLMVINRSGTVTDVIKFYETEQRVITMDAT